MLKIKYMAVSELIPYENNAKLHPEQQIDQIVHSIKEFGFNDPIAIWRDNVIIEGHGRLIAAQRIGMDQVPVVRLDDLTDEQRKAYTLIHNKLTMNSDFDAEILSLELAGIDEIDMSEYGFDLDELEEPDEIFEDEFELDESKEPVAKQGHLWQLGEHRLMCGDSSSPDDLDKLMGG